MPHMKVAHIQDLLHTVAERLREMNAERVSTNEKLAQLQGRTQAEMILSEAEERGLDLSRVVGTAQTKEAQVEALMQRGNLPALQEAVKLASRDLGVAQLGGKPELESETGMASEADFLAGIFEG